MQDRQPTESTNLKTKYRPPDKFIQPEWAPCQALQWSRTWAAIRSRSGEGRSVGGKRESAGTASKLKRERERQRSEERASERAVQFQYSVPTRLLWVPWLLLQLCALPSSSWCWRWWIWCQKASSKVVSWMRVSLWSRIRCSLSSSSSRLTLLSSLLSASLRFLGTLPLSSHLWLSLPSTSSSALLSCAN